MFANKKQKKSNNYVVIGGGIAGVCCAQELSRISDGHVVIISSSETLVEVRLSFLIYLLHSMCVVC
jgi:hypothetical protein